MVRDHVTLTGWLSDDGQRSWGAGCAHYRRRCEILAPCCNEWFPCHVCHDEAFKKPMSTQEAAAAAAAAAATRGPLVVPRGCCPEEMSRPANDGGRARRYLVQRVRCIDCRLEQPCGPSCIGCGIEFAQYFCAECKIYASPGAKGIFHCDKCNICRLGHPSQFWHCDTCCACFTWGAKLLPPGHKCIANSLEQNCPVCRGKTSPSTHRPIQLAIEIY